MTQQRDPRPNDRPAPSPAPYRAAPPPKKEASYARDRFMGEGLEGETAKPTEPTRSAEERASDQRGGGFDSQRTYADAGYGREEEAHRDAHAGYGRDEFGGRGERKDDTSTERPDDKPDHAAQVTRDRWNETSNGGIGQHEPAWQGNIGQMGVPERRYGQYGDGTSNGFPNGDASGYGGFRESGIGAPPEKEPVAPPAKQAAATPRTAGKKQRKNDPPTRGS